MGKKVEVLLKDAGIKLMEGEGIKSEVAFRGARGLLLTDKRLIYVERSGRITTILAGLHKDVSSVIRFSNVKRNLWLLIVGIVMCGAAIGTVLRLEDIGIYLAVAFGLK